MRSIPRSTARVQFTAGFSRRYTGGGDEATRIVMHMSNFRPVKRIDSVVAVFAKIAARVSQGVVTLTLPKAEEVKPRKITVS